MRGISWPAENRSASQVGLCCMSRRRQQLLVKCQQIFIYTRLRRSITAGGFKLQFISNRTSVFGIWRRAVCHNNSNEVQHLPHGTASITNDTVEKRAHSIGRSLHRVTRLGSSVAFSVCYNESQNFYMWISQFSLRALLQIRPTKCTHFNVTITNVTKLLHVSALTDPPSVTAVVQTGLTVICNTRTRLSGGLSHGFKLQLC